MLRHFIDPQIASGFLKILPVILRFATFIGELMFYIFCTLCFTGTFGDPLLSCLL